MPRPGPRRQAVGVRLSAPGLARVQELADRETGGNLSQMVRRLLTEALLTRDQGPARALSGDGSG